MKIDSMNIADLREDRKNARKHGKTNLAAIKGSLTKFGQQKPIVVNKKGVVIAGNGTLRAAKELGWEKIDVVRTELTGHRAKAFALADNRTAELAVWDDDILEETLAQLKLNDFDVAEIGFMDDFDPSALEGDGEKEDEQEYSKKIEAPVYEPQLKEPPPVSQLADYSKRDELIKEIKQANLPKTITEFLKAAATRHTVFDYELIAEYYAHAPKEVQELMEASALVIIDFKKAIEGGFVHLSKDIANTYQAEEFAGEK